MYRSAMVIRLPVKRAFDKSALPYFFRLANYDAEFSEPDIQDIQQLIQGVDSGSDGYTHLVLFGPGQSGKTTLAVGIGSELTARKARVRYISCSKYLDSESITGEKKATLSALNQPWLPEECQLLIVDDVKGDVTVTQRPQHVRSSIWVTDIKANAEQLLQNLQTDWLTDNEKIHLVDVQSLAYKPVK